MPSSLSRLFPSSTSGLAFQSQDPDGHYFVEEAGQIVYECRTLFGFVDAARMFLEECRGAKPPHSFVGRLKAHPKPRLAFSLHPHHFTVRRACDLADIPSTKNPDISYEIASHGSGND